MAIVTSQIQTYIETQSWIRRMFEAAAELKAKYGPEHVFDFSLGNPDIPPPLQVSEALKEIAEQARQPLSLGYCPNAGLPDLRAALSNKVSAEQQLSLEAKHLIVTNGAAGALNALMRSVLNSGDEVLCYSPYFVEYGFYVGNYGGTFVPVESENGTFAPNLNALEQAITPKTRMMIINSPNNPTGRIYSREELKGIAGVLREKSREYGQPILLVSDEPYRFLSYNQQVPAVLPLYRDSVVISSFSKSLSLAGARIGYLALNPNITDFELLSAGVTLSNRILGFVNAPVIGQKVVLQALNTGVDVTLYDDRRRAMAQLLDQAGLEYQMPQGAFYFFPKAPSGLYDQEFVDALRKENIIAVPGKGFGCPGYVRLSYCVNKDIIERAREPMLRVMQSIHQ
ncbi:MAG: pyridoxal phosphate-dependent aminotransferase [candidate division KSB1 bacterium]|nr:pyridoxal phosphate-dependent aminotransferase [candidate division KSB1 bacterium]